MILKGYEGCGPLCWEQVVHAAQMLTELDEYRTVLLKCSKCTFGAALMASFQKCFPLILMFRFAVQGRPVTAGEL